MTRERTPAGNILALARSRQDQAQEVEEVATSYMPTNIDLATLMPEEVPTVSRDSVAPGEGAEENHPAGKTQPGKRPATNKRSTQTGGSAGRKRISLYLDDVVLTKIFQVSLERHEQLSSATHRLIVEALKARGL